MEKRQIKIEKAEEAQAGQNLEDQDLEVRKRDLISINTQKIDTNTKREKDQIQEVVVIIVKEDQKAKEIRQRKSKN